jgi:hypothetical protein
MARLAPWSLLVALALAWPTGAAAVDLRLQAWAGVSRYDARGLKDGVVTQGHDLLQSDVNVYAGSLLLVLGALDLGALYEGGVISGHADTAILTPLVGFGFDLGESWRIDLLGELGGHQVSNIRYSGGVDVSQARAVWLPYLGARPTLSLRLPAARPSLVVSVAPFARWDLNRTSSTITVTQGTTVTPTTYELGGTTFGVVVGAGIEF